MSTVETVGARPAGDKHCRACFQHARQCLQSTTDHTRSNEVPATIDHSELARWAGSYKVTIMIAQSLPSDYYASRP